MFAFHELLTGNLTGTPKNFSVQSRTPVNKTLLQEPLGGRPRTTMDSRCRIPPSAVPSIYYEPLQNSSKATSCLRCFHRTLCTATLPQHCNPLISGRRYMAPCRTATERKLQRSHTYVRCMEATQDHPFSLDCLCEEDRWHTPANTKVGFSLGYTKHFLRSLPKLT